MKNLVFAVCLVTAGTSFGPALAHAQETGKELSQITFTGADQNNDGVLSFEEVAKTGANIFVSMDTNDDRSVSQAEFNEWDWGYFYLAEKKGETERYSAVKRILFALRDLNSDKRIDQSEMRIGSFTDFSRADLNHDRILSELEFLNAWTPILVLKSAHKG